MDKTNDLALIVRINEDIKVVVKLARSINILALNAILLARKAGDVALGFGVISGELRTFSKILTKNMEALMALSYSSIETVSSQQRRFRMTSLMQRALAEINSERVHLLLPHPEAEPAKQDDTLSMFDRLQSLLLEADEASRFGCVISRALKIEATYGGECREMLTQIALDFSLLIDAIPEVIKRINTNVSGKK